MPQGRTKARPTLLMTFWKKDGDLYYADKADLLAAIEASGNSEEVIRKRMGKGYTRLEDALAGKKMDGWGAMHVEWGLTSESVSKKSFTHSDT